MKFSKKIGMKNYWMLTYIVLFLIPIIILSLILLKVENIVFDFANSYSQSVLNQTQNKIDDEIKNIHKFTLNLSSFDELREVIKLDKISTDEMMKYYGIENSIYRSAINYNIDSDFYIYLKNSDTVLTNSGFLSTYNAYIQYASDFDISFEDWKEMLLDKNQFSFRKLTGKNSDKPDKLYIYCSLRDSIYTDVQATTVICVDKDKFSQILDTNLYGGTFYLTDKEGNIIFTFGNKNKLSNIDVNEFLNNGSHTEKRIGMNKFFFSANESSVGKYCYIVAIPVNLLTRQVGFLKLWLYMFIALTVFLGVFSVIKTVKKNYRPIEELIYEFESTFLENDKKNTLTYDSIDDIKKNLLTYSKNYNYGQKAVQAAQINRLLSFEMENLADSELNSLFSEFNKGSLVIIFEPGNYEDFFDGESESEKIDTVHFMINNVVSELLDDVYCLITENGKSLICIVALEYEKRAESDKLLMEKSRQLKEFFIDNFGFDVFVAFGSYEQNALGIRESYNNAQNVLLYKSVLGNSNVLCYSEISERENKHYFSAEDSKLLSNYIKFRNSEQAIKFIDEVFEDNINVKKISYKHIRILLFEIILTVQRAAENFNEGEINNNEIFKILQNFENIETFKEDIMLLVENLCSVDEDDDAENDVCRRIIEYINENYSNSNLSNDDIAEHCNISKSYLSTIFKREKKENLVSYITKLRVNKSKDLLLKDLNIADVANQSGFVNSNTYIRAFKKYENITPGLWRKRIKD